jgi:glycosyltransferase involved in cell wall biosynthesis
MKGISIVLATYNGSRYLEDLLKSLHEQTLPFNEIIVIDDASSDDTVEILNRFKDERYQIHLNHENIGVLESFEIGLKLARYDLISLCDQDDIWLREKLSVLQAQIGSHSLVYSDVKIKSEVRSFTNISFNEMNPLFGLDSRSELFLESLCFHSFILGCTVMFKREILSDALPLVRSSRNHDWWIAICAALAGGVKFIPKTLVMYRLHDKNVSVNKTGLLSLIVRLFRKGKSVDYTIAMSKAIDIFDVHERASFLVKDFKANIYDGNLLNRIRFTMRWSERIHPRSNALVRIVFSLIRPIRCVNSNGNRVTR